MNSSRPDAVAARDRTRNQARTFILGSSTERVNICWGYRYYVGCDGSVGIATGYGIDGPGIESRWGAKFSAPVHTGPGDHPASCTMGTGSFPGGKLRPGRAADHSPPSSAAVMEE